MKKLAFYLPQFHPIAENDKWWGKGFTEWTNVVKTKPRFKKHRQPQLPTDLGFYDLRVANVQEEQAKMARQFGIDGFIYYHYWFEGKRLLNLPLDNLLSSSIDFPFALCWANETWSRAWDGLEHQILIKQTYSNGDNLNHASFLTKIFKDNRYIKINGRPLFIIYRPESIPNISNLLKSINLECVVSGIKSPYFCAVRSGFSTDLIGVDINIFDAIIDFQPNQNDLPKPDTIKSIILNFLKKYLPRKIYQFLKRNGSANKKINYQKLVHSKIKSGYSYNSKVFPVCFPSWDNSPRRKTATIIQNDDPECFFKWIKFCADHISKYPKDEQLLFINAWNEWAEGCHLEPDTQMGYSFLKMIKKLNDQSY